MHVLFIVNSPKHAFALSRVLAETIGSNYVEVALDT